LSPVSSTCLQISVANHVAESIRENAQDTTPRNNRLGFLYAFRIWLVLFVLMILGAIVSGGVSARPSNVMAVLINSAPTAVATLGQTLVILTAGIDLSAAGVWVFSAVVGASLASGGVGLGLAVSASLAIGLGFGLMNGLLIAVLGVPPLVTTLGTLSMSEGLARVYTGNVPVLTLPASFIALGGWYFGPVPLSVLILLTALLTIIFVTDRTIIGTSIRAVGFNPIAAKYAGLRVTATLIFVYAVAGVLAALAGILQAAYLQEALPNVDMNTLFAIIGGVVVGGTALTGGHGHIVNSLGGVLVIMIVQNLMNILGISPLLEEGVLGAIVICAVYLNIGFDGQVLRAWAERVGGSFSPRKR
jgi:ribose transport system permease protein